MDLSIPRGDARLFVVTVTSAGAPLDLTGKTLRWEAARDVGQPPLITKATGTGITHDPDQTANPGRATIELLPADTADLPNARVILLWEMETTSAGNPYTTLTGRLEVTPELVTA